MTTSKSTFSAPPRTNRFFHLACKNPTQSLQPGCSSIGSSGLSVEATITSTKIARPRDPFGRTRSLTVLLHTSLGAATKRCPLNESYWYEVDGKGLWLSLKNDVSQCVVPTWFLPPLNKEATLQACFRHSSRCNACLPKCCKSHEQRQPAIRAAFALLPHLLK